MGNSFQDRNLKLNKGQLEGNIDRSNRSASSTSSETSTDNDTLVNSIRNIGRCSKKSSFEEEAENPFSSGSRKSPTHFPPLSTFRGCYSVSNETSPSQAHFSAEWHSLLEFSENSVKWVDHSQSDNSMPVTFDYSDGPKFDSDDEMEKSESSGTKDSNILPREQDVFTLNPSQQTVTVVMA
ncbi:hypothetical protein LguiA_005182 [Lonicera macranthoides]